MNIPDQLQQIFVFLADNGLVPTFEEMPGLMVLDVKVLGVPLLKSLHEFGEWVRRTLNQQMDVVGHQQ